MGVVVVLVLPIFLCLLHDVNSEYYAEPVWCEYPPNNVLNAEENYTFSCNVPFSQPPARVIILINGQPMNATETTLNGAGETQYQQVTGTYTTSFTNYKTKEAAVNVSCLITETFPPYDEISRLDPRKYKLQFKPLTQVVVDKLVVPKEGSAYTLTCAVIGWPAPNPNTFRWYKNDALLSETLTSPVLTFDHLGREKHNGRYTCATHNDVGKSEEHTPFDLKVFYLGGVRLHPFTINPVGLGEETTAHCGVVDAFPEFVSHISWAHGTDNLSPNHHYSFFIHNLTIKKVVEESAGKYTCTLETFGGKKMSNELELFVKHPPFTNQAFNTLVYGMIGESLSLPCEVSAVPAPNVYVWHKNGLSATNTTKSTLVIPSVTDSDFGDYSCTVKNELGEITLNLAVTQQFATDTTTREIKMPVVRLDTNSLKYDYHTTLLSFTWEIKVGEPDRIDLMYRKQSDGRQGQWRALVAQINANALGYSGITNVLLECERYEFQLVSYQGDDNMVVQRDISYEFVPDGIGKKQAVSSPFPMEIVAGASLAAVVILVLISAPFIAAKKRKQKKESESQGGIDLYFTDSQLRAELGDQDRVKIHGESQEEKEEERRKRLRELRKLGLQ